MKMTKFEALFADDYHNVGYYVKRKETIGNYLLGRTLGEETFAKVNSHAYGGKSKLSMY